MTCRPGGDPIRVHPQAAAFLSSFTLTVGEFARLAGPDVMPDSALRRWHQRQNTGAERELLPRTSTGVLT